MMITKKNGRRLRNPNLLCSAKLYTNQVNVLIHRLFKGIDGNMNPRSYFLCAQG